VWIWTERGTFSLATLEQVGSKSHFLVSGRNPSYVACGLCRGLVGSCSEVLISTQIWSCSYPMKKGEDEIPAMLQLHHSVETTVTHTRQRLKLLPRSSRCLSLLSHALNFLQSCHYQRNSDRPEEREIDGNFVFVGEVNYSNHRAVKESPFCLGLCCPCTF
jgi:hypothetical protein